MSEEADKVGAVSGEKERVMFAGCHVCKHGSQNIELARWGSLFEKELLLECHFHIAKMLILSS